jgi:hypothetical protein
MRRREWLLAGLVLAATAVALAVRLAHLGDANMWYDEGISVWAARKSLADMVTWTASDTHPPLYYALLHLWLMLAGNDSETTVRLPSLIFGTLNVPAVWLLARTLLPGRSRVAIASATLLALSRFNVWWSQETRMYALAALLATLHLVFTALLARRITPWSALGYVVTGVLGLWTLYLLVVLFLVDALYWLVTTRLRIQPLVRRLGLSVLAGCMFTPWVAFAIPRMQSWSVQTPFDAWSFVRLYTTLLLLGHSTYIEAVMPLVLILAAALVVGLTALRLRDPAAAEAARLPLMAVVVPALLVWVVTAVPRSVGYIPPVEARYLLPFAPAFALVTALAAEGLASCPQARWRAATTFVVLAALVSIDIWSIGDYMGSRYLADDGRSVAETLRAYAEPSDGVVLHSDQPWPVFAYYWRGEFVGVPYGQQVTAESAAALLAPLWERSDAVFVVVNADALRIDPNRLVEAWLAPSAAATRTWRYGDTRLLLYARTPNRAAHIDDLAAGFAPPPTPAAAQALGLVGWEQPLQRVRSGEPSFAALTVAGSAPAHVQVGLGDASSQVDIPVVAAERRVPVTVVLPRTTPPGQAAWWAEADGERVALGQAEVVSTTDISATDRGPPPPEITVESVFGEPPFVRLDGYDRDVVAGVHIGVTLHWHVLGTSPISYKVYVHLLDAAGRLAVQRDDVPDQGSRPTTGWAPGDDVLDTYVVPLSASMLPGDYHLEVGLYDPATGERLGPVRLADDSDQPEREVGLGTLTLP